MKLQNNLNSALKFPAYTEDTKIKCTLKMKVLNAFINVFTLGIYQYCINSKLKKAVISNDLNKMFYLIRVGASVKKTSIIMLAAQKGHIQAMKVLLNHGANINATEVKTSTSGSLGLGQNGLEYTTYDHVDDSYTVLDMASRFNQNAMVDFLIKQGALKDNTDKSTKFGSSTLLYNTTPKGIFG